ncbi:MAG: hypothetical protein ACRDRI_03250 [Pseudonocardiaceae bacterium]
MPAADPVMAVLDRLLLTSPENSPDNTVHEPAPPTGEEPVPFGLRFAVTPVHAGKHGKTYRTINELEATHINQDGTVVVRQDPVQREEED